MFTVSLEELAESCAAQALVHQTVPLGSGEGRGEREDSDSKIGEDCRPSVCWEMMCALSHFCLTRLTPEQRGLQLRCTVLLLGV